MAELIWEPNDGGHFHAVHRNAVQDITVTIGADSRTKRRSSSGIVLTHDLKRPYYDLWMEVDGDTIIDLGRCKHDIKADALYDKVLVRARLWLHSRWRLLAAE